MAKGILMARHRVTEAQAWRSVLRIRFFDSGGIKALATVRSRIRWPHCVVLAGDPVHVRTILDLTGSTALFRLE